MHGLQLGGTQGVFRLFARRLSTKVMTTPGCGLMRDANPKQIMNSAEILALAQSPERQNHHGLTATIISGSGLGRTTAPTSGRGHNAK